MHITKSTTIVPTVRLESCTATWYGLYNRPAADLTAFSIQLNYRTITRDAPDDRRWVTSSSSHEFGHIFRMDDNPNTTSVSLVDDAGAGARARQYLMKHSRDRTTVYGPSPTT